MTTVIIRRESLDIDTHSHYIEVNFQIKYLILLLFYGFYAIGNTYYKICEGNSAHVVLREKTEKEKKENAIA